MNKNSKNKYNDFMLQTLTLIPNKIINTTKNKNKKKMRINAAKIKIVIHGAATNQN
jgi:hypothetical protein